jgi:hypothetical protein
MVLTRLSHGVVHKFGLLALSAGQSSKFEQSPPGFRLLRNLPLGINPGKNISPIFEGFLVCREKLMAGPPSTATTKTALIMDTTTSTHRRIKVTRTNKKPVDKDTDQACLVELLISPQRYIQFSTYTKSNTALFGGTSTPKLHKKVRSRRKYLLHLQEENFSASLNLCAT